MDPSNALRSKLDPSAWDITNQVLRSMSRKFRLANEYSVDLARVASRYTESWKRWRIAGGSPQSTSSDGDGGLHEYATSFETPHKQFGSLASDGGESESKSKHPNDMAYIRLSELDHDEESRDSATPHSPVVSLKTEREEPRRSTSTATSVQSSFTPVNSHTPARKESVSAAIETTSGNRASYGPTTTHGSHSHYPDQQVHYPPTSAYGYTRNAPAFSQSTQYNLQSAYVQSSGPTQGPSSRPLDSDVISTLEREGNISISTQDVEWFEIDHDQQSYPSYGYLYDQPQAQMQYMQNSQGAYMYPGPWSGQG